MWYKYEENIKNKCCKYQLMYWADTIQVGLLYKTTVSTKH
jgi:hypothetical protein